MSDSFRKRAHKRTAGAAAIARNRSCFHPIWGKGLTAKLLIFLLLPLAAAGCRTAPRDDAPPDVIKQITMKKWEIEPSRIEVAQGEEVELVVTSADVEHGIAIAGLGIREPVQPGRPTVVKFRAKKAGTYRMSCSILCGKGHDRMTGEIVVAAPLGGGSR